MLRSSHASRFGQSDHRPIALGIGTDASLGVGTDASLGVGTDASLGVGTDTIEAPIL